MSLIDLLEKRASHLRERKLKQKAHLRKFTQKALLREKKLTVTRIARIAVL